MDERLEELNTGKGKVSAQLVRIKKISVENFRFFKDKIDLNFENKNVLIYGENGSGKSSIYRAMEYLSKEKFNSLITDRNIFSKENISDMWIVPANPEKIYQDLNFNNVLSLNLYSEKIIIANSIISLNGQSSNLLQALLIEKKFRLSLNLSFGFCWLG